MPEGFLALFFIQIVSTLSFSVLYSTLVLYMKDKLGLQAHVANNIMGVFIALNYALHLLGGFWGGRLLSNRALFVIGMLAQAIGCILLSVADVSFLYYGLAAYLTGSSLNVTCLNCMLTQRFSSDDTRRETAFLWNYAGMNIGFFIGYSFSGLFQLAQNYQQLFLWSCLGNICAMLICLYYWRQLADKNTIFSQKNKRAQQQSIMLGSCTIICLPFLLTFIIHYAVWANKLVILTGLSMLAYILWAAYQRPSRVERHKIFSFAVLLIVSFVFWMLYQIAPMGLTFFIAHNVQRVFVDVVIPPQWFQNVNTLTIIIGGPILSALLNKMRKKGVEVNIPAQFALALLCIGCSFILLPISIYYANTVGIVNPSWIVLCYFLQGLGELLISPIGFAMIGFLAPAHLQGVMMGMWMLNAGVAATASSYSSNLMLGNQAGSLSPLITNSSYSHVFFILGLLALGSSALLFLFIAKLRALMHETKKNTCGSESLINTQAIG